MEIMERRNCLCCTIDWHLREKTSAVHINSDENKINQMNCHKKLSTDGVSLLTGGWKEREIEKCLGPSALFTFIALNNTWMNSYTMFPSRGMQLMSRKRTYMSVFSPRRIHPLDWLVLPCEANTLTESSGYRFSTIQINLSEDSLYINPGQRILVASFSWVYWAIHMFAIAVLPPFNAQTSGKVVQIPGSSIYDMIRVEITSSTRYYIATYFPEP